MATLRRNLNLTVPCTSNPNHLVRTKIVCTIGPGTKSVDRLQAMLAAGMNVVRCNFSHGTHEYHGEVIDNAREAIRLSGKSAAILLDTKGPEIRTGKVKNGSIQLVAGQTIEVSTDTTEIGDEKRISLDYKALCTSVKVGGNILIADGLIALSVESIDKEANVCRCRVNNNAVMGSTKNVHLPGAVVELPAVSAKDLADLKFGVTKKVDFVAASFIRKPEDVIEIRTILGAEGKDIKIISKIESTEGLENFDAILRESDGIMVARGDLGVELPMEQIFIAQKMMISKCNYAAKPVITATQMLESMISAPRPTRAECSDVANAVLDGSDAVMLSGETASGDYPLEAISIMKKLCLEAERTETCADYAVQFRALVKSSAALSDDRSEVTASYAVRVAMDMKAKAMIVMSHDGLAHRWVSKYRPSMPFVALCTDSATAAAAAILRGAYPYCISPPPTLNALAAAGLDYARLSGMVRAGDLVVLFTPTEGVEDDVPGTTTLTVKVLEVGDGGTNSPVRSQSPAP